jgi:hypothetical protein
LVLSLLLFRARLWLKSLGWCNTGRCQRLSSIGPARDRKIGFRLACGQAMPAPACACRPNGASTRLTSRRARLDPLRTLSCVRYGHSLTQSPVSLPPACTDCDRQSKSSIPPHLTFSACAARYRTISLSLGPRCPWPHLSHICRHVPAQHPSELVRVFNCSGKPPSPLSTPVPCTSNLIPLTLSHTL